MRALATIENRSRYVVRVRHRPDLDAQFPYTRTDALKAHVSRLRCEGYKPTVARLEDAIFVRIRQEGFEPFQVTLGSYEEAEKTIRHIKDERPAACSSTTPARCA